MPAKLNFLEIVDDFVKVKEEIKRKESKLKKYRDLILGHVQELGEKDEKGEIHFPIGDFIVHDKKRVSQKVDDVLAEEVLKRKGIYQNFVSVKLDEDKLEEGILNGAITSDEAKSFLQVKVVDVLEVEKISEIKSKERK